MLYDSGVSQKRGANGEVGGGLFGSKLLPQEGKHIQFPNLPFLSHIF